MKAVLALALIAVLGFTVAGCGSGKKNDLSTQIAQNYAGGTTTVATSPGVNPGGPDVGSTAGSNGVGPVTVTGTSTRTIPNVSAGTQVTCRTRHGVGATVKVPPVGVSVAEGQRQSQALGQKHSPTQQITVTHLEDGSITVSCSQSM